MVGFDKKFTLALKKSSSFLHVMYMLDYVLLRMQKPVIVDGELSDLQKLRIELVNNNWRINAAWITYELALEAFDIRRSPFDRAWYHKQRTLSRLYCSLLILCENCFSKQTAAPPYFSVLEWWIACMRDFKENDIISIFKDAGTNDAPIHTRDSKSNYVKGLRSSYKCLKDERQVPGIWKESDQLPVVSNLLETSLELAWGKIGSIDFDKAGSDECKYFRENFWNLFLDCFDAYINDVKGGTWWTGFFVKNGKLYYYACGSSRILPFKGWHKSVQQWWLREIGQSP